MNHLSDELLNEYLDKLLDEPTLQKVETHLAQCDRCRSHLEELALVFSSLEGLPELPLGRDLVPGVLARLPETKKIKPLWRQPAFILQFLSTLILLGVAGGPIWRTMNRPLALFTEHIVLPAVQLPSLSLPQFNFTLPDSSGILPTSSMLPVLPGNLETSTWMMLLVLVGILWMIGNFTLLRSRPEK